MAGSGRRVRVAVIGAGRMSNCVHYPSLASGWRSATGTVPSQAARLAAFADAVGQTLHRGRILN